MPTDFELAHALAIVWLFVLWFGYTPIMRLAFNGSINQRLSGVRTVWLEKSLNRSQRTFDAILLGHLVGSITFFGSATMLVLVGAVSLFASDTLVYDALSLVHLHNTPSYQLYLVQALALNVVMAISFFAFVYALRKLIYGIALIGALPETAEANVAQSDRRRMLEASSAVLTSALTTFNFGIRGYYYAVAAFGLFLSPYVCLILASGFTVLLVYRQKWSTVAQAIDRYVTTEHKSS